MDNLKTDLIKAWNRSEKMTMTTVNQMPEDLFFFKYTEEAMTFSEQWRHCVLYTCSQLKGRIGITNPFENKKLAVQMPKNEIVTNLQLMYNHVRESIKNSTLQQLTSSCEFAGDSLPVWQFF